MRALGLLVLLAGPAFAGDCRPDALDVRGPAGMVHFSVEIADDAAERAQGLMNRKSLPRSAGMLFLYQTEQQARFWMKNTLIPLDMIFADASGRVSHVHSDAVPRDKTVIDGGPGVLMVLEINGGLAARLGIGVGSALRHPGIDQAIAAWPCG